MPGQKDVITDFSFADGDRIELSAIDADVYAAGNQALAFVGMAAFSPGLDHRGSQFTFIGQDALSGARSTPSR